MDSYSLVMGLAEIQALTATWKTLFLLAETPLYFREF